MTENLNKAEELVKNEPKEDSKKELIDTAVKFLQNPKLASSPLDQKKSFLKSKGLSEEEVATACQLAGINNTQQTPVVQTPQQIYPLMPLMNNGGWIQKFRDFANFVVLISGAAYGLHYLWKRYIHPWLLNRPFLSEKSSSEKALLLTQDLQRSITDLVTCVKELQESVTSQNALLSKLLNQSYPTNDILKPECEDIKAEIRSLKGLMLSTSRFPSNPPVTPLSIPQWQLSSDKERDKKSPSPDLVTANGNGLEKEKDDGQEVD